MRERLAFCVRVGVLCSALFACTAEDPNGPTDPGPEPPLAPAVRWSDPALDLPASFSSASPMNIMGYRNAEVDAALERLAGLTDAQEVAQVHREVLRQVLRDLPVIFLSHKEAFHIVDRQAVRDWKLFYSLRPLIEDAWLA